MADLETSIRQELGIPDEAQHVLILSMDAHMDWDWQATFESYLYGTNPYHSAVTDVIDSAFACMNGTGPAPSTYYYSVCEMGFFAEALEANPALLDNFQQNIGERLRIVGGGVTSPDNLLPHGEAIVRNYLLGKTWMQETLGLPLRQAYVPDDFGNDSQFPVLLEAMGFQGVSFSRIPGAPNQGPAATYSGGQSLNNTLVNNAEVDFVWQAADGSTTVAHYMQQTYCQGNGIATDPEAQILKYLSTNEPSAPTPYIYVPCGCDFAMPITNLVEIAADWNTANFKGGPNDVYTVVATLDHYIQLVSTYINPATQHSYGPYKNLLPMQFLPTPYWTGHYASRIRNKILHQAATRALLGAETFSTIADIFESPDATGFQWLTEGRWQAIDNGWQGLVPSTHHDYINGTATDGVTTSEQVPLLAGTLQLAAGARNSAVAQIAAQVAAEPSPGETPVVVFNQLGFAAVGPTSVPAIPTLDANSVTFPDGTSSPVQKTHENELLFVGSAPSLGYQTGYLSPQTLAPAESASIVLGRDGDSGEAWILSNGPLTVVVSKGLNWGLYSIIDNATGIDMISATGTGNNVQFYIDGGGIYRFGNEYNDSTTFEIDPHGTLTAERAEVLEHGPLRVWLRTTATFTSKDRNNNAITGTYVRDYILVAGELFLRMSFTGAAPLTASGAPNTGNAYEGNQYSVMVQFPFGSLTNGAQVAVDTVSYGTPAHWVEQMPDPYWSAPIFQAMHNVAVVGAGGDTLGALYQSTIPAWGVAADGSFIGCVLRNTPQDAHSHGANGQDTLTHTHHYAVRVPSGIGAMGTGEQLQESLLFSTPLRAHYGSLPVGTNGLDTGSFPPSFSLASASPSSAIITAAKPGALDTSSLILRLYQPTNASLDITVTLAEELTSDPDTTVQIVTALEDQIDGEEPLAVANASVEFTAERAITTLEVATPTS